MPDPAKTPRLPADQITRLEWKLEAGCLDAVFDNVVDGFEIGGEEQESGQGG